MASEIFCCHSSFDDKDPAWWGHEFAKERGYTIQHGMVPCKHQGCMYRYERYITMVDKEGEYHAV